MITKIRKRDGREVPFNIEKIADAIFKAAQAVGGQDYNTSLYLAEKVATLVEKNLKNNIPTVEDIQDAVEKVLIENGKAKTAKEYILYRSERSKVRDMNTRLMKVFEDLTFNREKKITSAMETMLEYGFESAKEFYDLFVLNPEHAAAHKNGDVYIHDLEFLALTTENCQMDLIDLLREKYKDRLENITDYVEALCLFLEMTGNDQHGGKSIPNFDYLMSLGVEKTYKENYRKNLKKAIKILMNELDLEENIDNIFETLYKEYQIFPRLDNNAAYIEEERKYLGELIWDLEKIKEAEKFAENAAYFDTKEMTLNAMKYLVRRVNNMYSLGTRTLETTINFGTDTSPEGRMVIESFLRASYDLLMAENYIYPIKVFKIKDGVNYKEEDINYDFLQLAIKLASRNATINFSFLDADYNNKYYRINNYSTEVAYFGNGDRIMENTYNKKEETSLARGNLSTTSLNLPRLALKSGGNKDLFFKLLEDAINLVVAQLLERFEIQGSRKAKEYPYLIKEGIWIDSLKLRPDDEIRDILKNGSLSLGFLGLYETVLILYGSYDGGLGEEILKYIKDILDGLSSQLNMNFHLRATNSKELSRRFFDLDKERFKTRKELKDLNQYTEGFKLLKEDNLARIKSEARYFKYTNGGHILTLEVVKDDPAYLEDLIRLMKENNIGLGNIKVIRG